MKLSNIFDLPFLCKGIALLILKQSVNTHSLNYLLNKKYTIGLNSVISCVIKLIFILQIAVLFVLFVLIIILNNSEFVVKFQLDLKSLERFLPTLLKYRLKSLDDKVDHLNHLKKYFL